MFSFEENESRKNKLSWWFLEGFVRMIDAPPTVREGYARYHMYTNLPVYINPGELIVGNLNWALSKELIYNNVANQEINEWNLNEFRESEKYSRVEKMVVEEYVRKIKPYTLNDIEDRLCPDEQKVSRSSAGGSNHFNGHMILDYDKILHMGLGGYKDLIRTYMRESVSERDYQFYNGLLYTLEGYSHYIFKHALAAEYLLENKCEGYDEKQLRIIIRNCRKLSEKPADSFLEALQLFWFMFMAGDYDSYGRFDQILYEFYRKDREIRDEQELENYLKYFLNKGEQNRGILNMTIGGTNPDGSCAVNDLTWLILKVVSDLGYKSPNLCLRLTSKSDQRLYERVHHNLSKGQAIPALYNDAIIIPMLLSLGIKKEDAYDYSLAGCSQVIIPGKSNFCCDVGVYNALKVLELALHDGYDRRLQEQVGPHTGTAEQLDSYEKLYEAYITQMHYTIEKGVSINNKDVILRKDMPSCIRTLFTQGCLETGKAIFEGGAVYNGIQNEIIGLTNVANSMYAVKKLVFEENKLSLEELVHVLDCNYEGYEELRQIIKNKVDKFGNDKEEVDQIRATVGKEFYEYLSGFHTPIGGIHWPGEVIFQSHINLMPFTLASPDGRKDFEALADSAGAAQGTDISGPTALIKSVTKIPYTYPTISRNLNLKFPKELFKGEPEKIIALFRAYFEMEGCQLQINVVDREELLDAQKNPENYKNLVVRIGGYNDYFVEIPKEMQDEVISRTGQSI
ncbi:MAG: pyruvate formate lyase family protein [Oliverpabstia sp.]|nr:pyruvate formate lyase family protein [Oliverpabstia sp.]